MKKIIYTSNAPQPVGPYSQAIMSGDMLFTSGQIGIDPSQNKMVSDELEDQAKQVMENLKNLLYAAGMDFSHVIRCTIFLTDLSNFKTVNEIYGSYFSSEPPARETAEVSHLPLNAKLEISIIASL